MMIIIRKQSKYLSKDSDTSTDLKVQSEVKEIPKTLNFLKINLKKS